MMFTRLMAALVGTALFIASPTAAKRKSADEFLKETPKVYYCTDAKSGGVNWGKKNPQGDGRVTSFVELHYILKVISKTQRNVTLTTGLNKGTTSHLSCRARWPRVPTLLTCTDRTGLEAWAFNGNNYIRSFINGRALKHAYTDDNIMVAHGTCAK